MHISKTIIIINLNLHSFRHRKMFPNSILSKKRKKGKRMIFLKQLNIFIQENKEHPIYLWWVLKDTDNSLRWVEDLL